MLSGDMIECTGRSRVFNIVDCRTVVFFALVSLSNACDLLSFRRNVMERETGEHLTRRTER